MQEQEHVNKGPNEALQGNPKAKTDLIRICREKNNSSPLEKNKEILQGNKRHS